MKKWLRLMWWKIKMWNLNSELDEWLSIRPEELTEEHYRTYTELIEEEERSRP